MKVCIVGLGAIGGVLAASLGAARDDAGAAIELSALVRGPTLAALRAHGGLVVRDARPDAGGAPARTVALTAHDDAAALGEQDLVVLAVKGPALAAQPALADTAAPLIGAHTRVMTAMNGLPWWFFAGLAGPCRGLALPAVDPGGRWRARVPPERTLGAVLHLSSRVPAPGVVEAVQGRGIVVGRALGGTAADLAGGGTAADLAGGGTAADRASGGTAADPAGGDPVLRALADALARGALEVTVSPRIQHDVWFKLWGNMTMNPVSALTGATADRILDDELVRGFISAVMAEARTLGAAFGVPIEQTPEQRHAVTRRLGAFRTSMLQDVEAGRALEIDALLTAVRDVAQHLRQPTPALDALLGLTRLMARSRGLYPLPA